MTQARLTTVLARGWWLILFAVIACVAVAVFATRQAEKVYEASALIRVDRGAQLGASADAALSVQEASKSLAGTYAATIGSRSFLARIAPEVLGGDLDAAELAGRTDAAALPETSIVELSARGASPAAAQQLAADVAAGFLAALREDTRQQIAAQRRDLQARIASLDEAIGLAGEGSVEALRAARADLTARLAEVLGATFGADGVTLSAPPSASADPISPRPLLNLVAAILVGVLVGVALAWLWVGQTAGRVGVSPGGPAHGSHGDVAPPPHEDAARTARAQERARAGVGS